MQNDLHPLSNFIDALESILKNMVFMHHVQKMNPAVSKFISKQNDLFCSNDNRSCHPTLLGWFRAQKAIDEIK